MSEQKCEHFPDEVGVLDLGLATPTDNRLHQNLDGKNIVKDMKNVHLELGDCNPHFSEFFLRRLDVDVLGGALVLVRRLTRSANGLWGSKNKSIINQEHCMSKFGWWRRVIFIAPQIYIQLEAN